MAGFTYKRLAYALADLRTEVNTKWPGRSKASDGTLGDTAHATRTSDHNPNKAGVVRAMDITAAGIDAAWYAEHIRQLGLSGHEALRNHGYVIYNGRAAYATNGWVWVKYNGTNKHDKHIHVSVGEDAGQYDSRHGWGLFQSIPIPPNTPHDEPGETMNKAQQDWLSMRLSAIDQQQVRILDNQKLLGDAVFGPLIDDKGHRGEGIIHETKYVRTQLLSGGNDVKLQHVLDEYGTE